MEQLPSYLSVCQSINPVHDTNVSLNGCSFLLLRKRVTLWVVWRNKEENTTSKIKQLNTSSQAASSLVAFLSWIFGSPCPIRFIVMLNWFQMENSLIWGQIFPVILWAQIWILIGTTVFFLKRKTKKYNCDIDNGSCGNLICCLAENSLIPWPLP